MHPPIELTDERGRLRFSTVKHPSGATNLDSVTEIRYYPNGLVERVILPDTTFLRYEYNDARHLTAVENSVGERVEFDPSELNGEWETATTKDASLITKRIQNRVQDELGRLRQLLGNNNQSTTYTYDADDNLVLEDKDGEFFDTQTVRDYGFLHRLTKITEPLAIVTELGYDIQGNVDTVIDPNLNTTTYLYDGFGELIRQVSPDTGMTRYWYDKAGNLIQQVDANDIQIDFDYDELNRMISKAYPNSTQENVSYRYDDYSGATQYPNAKGRLTEVSYEEGLVIYVYDHRGNVIERIQTIQSTSYTTQYVYNLADEIIGITDPSGREVIYTEDPTSGRITSVTTKETASSPEETIASNITYHPFGPVSGFTHGNQLVTNIPFDPDYRVDRIDVLEGTTEILRRNYGYDWFNNVNVVTDEVDSTYSKTFEYDVLQRLSDAYGTYLSGTSNHIHYGYDSNSNRNQREFRFNENTISSETYTYSTVSNRLDTVAKNGGVDRSFGYDSVGNLKSDAAKLLQYNHANRLIGVEENSQLLSEDHQESG